MIKTNELRIGNVVTERDNYKLYTVAGISETWVKIKNYWSCGEVEHINYNRLMPVKLTPEILEFCGFKEGRWFYRDQPGYWMEDYFVSGNWFHYWQGANLAKIISYDVRYLHTLQNIMFALKSEELIKDLKLLKASIYS